MNRLTFKAGGFNAFIDKNMATYGGIQKDGSVIYIGDIADRLAAYEDLEERIQNIYGECNGLLETVVEQLEQHAGIDLPKPVFKTKLLTDDDVDRWEKYKRLDEQGKGTENERDFV